MVVLLAPSHLVSHLSALRREQIFQVTYSRNASVVAVSTAMMISLFWLVSRMVVDLQSSTLIPRRSVSQRICAAIVLKGTIAIVKAPLTTRGISNAIDLPAPVGKMATAWLPDIVAFTRSSCAADLKVA